MIMNVKAGGRMFKELPLGDYHKCRNLVSDHKQLEAIGVIEGINTGRVFVDNKDDPRCGFVWLGNHDGMMFFGDERASSVNQLPSFIDDQLSFLLKKEGISYFEGVSPSLRWDRTMEQLFHDRIEGRWTQRIYRLDSSDFKQKSEPKIDESYQLVNVETCLQEKTGSTTSSIEKKILETWHSTEEFLRYGHGYGILINGQIVSLCYTGFMAHGLRAIHVETHQDHRGKQLAQAVVHRFITHCLEENEEPYWDCTETNAPSIKVAERLGFHQSSTYQVYGFSL